MRSSVMTLPEHLIWEGLASCGGHWLCGDQADLALLEVICAHLLIASVAVEALDAFVCKLLTWIEVL
jgi:hypothetical protein